MYTRRLLCRSALLLGAILGCLNANPSRAGVDWALSLSGNGCYVVTPPINLNGSHALTLEAWIQPRNITSSGNSEIIRQDSFQSLPDWLFSFQFGGTVLSFGMNIGGNYQELRAAVNPASLTDGHWHHVAAVYDGATKTIYLDGVAIGSASQTGAVPFLGSVNAIGAWAGFQPYEYFNGQIDEVRVWAVARSPLGIQYDMSHVLTGNESGLAAYYAFNEGAGLVAHDSGPNQKHGTLISGPVWVPSTAPSVPVPVPITGPPAAITVNSMTLAGTANPGGSACSTYFEYGPTIGYGSQSPAQNLGNGTVAVPVTFLLAGLAPASPIHYRLVAMGAVTNYGQDLLVFTVGTSAGTALNFTAQGQMVSFPPIGPAGGNALTLEAWIKPSLITQIPLAQILGQGNPNARDWMIAVENFGATLAFGLNAGGGYEELTAPLMGGELSGGSWHHVAATYDGTIKKLYLDGVLRATAPKTGAVVFSTIAGAIGAAIDGSNAYQGLVDEVRVWNVARTAPQIAQVMTQMLAGSETGLAAYWRFDDGSGSVAGDASLANSPGLLVNGPAWVASTAPVLLPTMAPAPRTGLADHVGPSSVMVHGDVNPLGLSAFAWFEYGTTTNYGSQTTPAGLAAGIAPSPITFSIPNLAANQVYHWRVVATNLNGLANGVDHTLAGAGPVNDTPLQFDGVDNYMIAPAVDLTSANQLTIEAWIQPTSLSPPATSVVLQQGTDFFLGFRNNGAALVFSLPTFSPAGYFANQEVAATVDPAAIVDGRWHHLAGTYSGNALRLYVDGSLVGYTVATGKLQFSPAAAITVASDGLGTGSFSGLIQEVRIWQVAHDAAVLHQYQYASLGGYEPGLAAYWRFDEGGGSSVLDASSGRHTGVLVNQPVWTTAAQPLSANLGPPVVLPKQVLAVTTNSVVLQSRVAPAGIGSLAWLEYGPTAYYGLQTPPRVVSGLPSSGFEQPLTGLSPATQYHWRIKATNGVGTNFGPDSVFYTSGAGPGNALNFDGVSQSVQLSAPLTNLNGSYGLTLEAWIKPADLVSHAAYGIIGEQGGNSQPDFLLQFRHHGAVLVFGVLASGVYGELSAALNPAGLTDGSWHHLAAVWDGGKKLIYVDGALVASGGAQTGRLVFSSPTATIGVTSGQTDFFAGQIDEVRVWNVGLSAAQVNQSLLSPLAGYEAGLAAYFPLNEGVGDTTTDYSINGLTGTLLNQPPWLASTAPLNPLAVPPGFGAPAATTATINSATFSATVYPGAAGAMAYFEYGPTLAYGNATAPQTLALNQPTLIFATVSGLLAGQSYHWHVVVSNALSVAVGPDQQLTATNPVTTLPTAVSGSVLNLAIGSATLSGTAGTLGSSTTIWVDYGADSNFGLRSPTQTVPAGAPASVTVALSSLLPATRYHWRLTATNFAGVVHGADQFFFSAGTSAGNCVVLDGGTGVVGTPPIDLSSSSALSLEAWIKPNDFANNYYSDVIRQRGDPYFGNPDWLLGFRNNGTLLVFGLIAGGTYQELSAATSPALLNDGGWHHVAATYDGLVKTLYLDGISLAAATNQFGLIGFAGTTNAIGASVAEVTALDFFPGAIDEVRIWKTPRSAAQIAQEMTRIQPTNHPELAAYWRFDETSGGVAVDVTGHGYDGRLTSGVIRTVSTAPLAPFQGPPSVLPDLVQVSTNTVILNALVNPLSRNATAWFEYGLTASYGNPILPVTLGNGAASLPFSQPLAGLQAAQTYHWRVVATNDTGASATPDATFVTYGAAARTALRFDGSNSVTLPSIDTSAGTGLTIEAWLKPLTLPGTGATAMLVRQDGVYYHAPDFTLCFANGANLIFGVPTGGGYTEFSVPINPTAMLNGAWHHVAGTYDGVAARIYLDGVQISSNSLSGPLAFQGTILALGSIGGNNSFYKGMLDELSLWNLARSAAQINQDRSHGLFGTETGLLAYWRFDDAAGLVLRDATPAGHDGRLVNPPVWVPSDAPLQPLNTGPYILSDFVGDLMPNSATLHGVAAPGGLAALAWFQYGTDASYGFQTDPVNVGMSFGSIDFSASLPTLSPGQSYHWRAIGTNVQGITYGVDRVFMTPVVNPAGAALSLDGARDTVVLPALSFAAGNTLTLETWIKPFDFSGYPTADLIRQQAPNTSSDYLLSVRSNGLALAFGVTTTSGYRELVAGLGATPILPGTWHQIAGVYDGTVQKLYVDGVLIGSTNQSGNIAYTATAAFLGSAGGSANFFNGLIDEVRFWRVSRSAADLNQYLHNGLAGNESGLVNYLRFDEGAGLKAVDYTGHDRAGSLQGAEWIAENAPVAAYAGLAVPLFQTVHSTTAGSVTLNGAVNPAGQPTQAWFEYGLTTNYGAQTLPANLGSGPVPARISLGISGLIPALTYHYRLVAARSTGTNFGIDGIFVNADAAAGSALSFNGANHPLLVLARHYFQNYSNAVTIEAWVKPVDITTNETVSVFQSGYGGPVIGFANYGRTLNFNPYQSGLPGGVAAPINPADFMDGNWHHLAGTFDGTNELVFKDGQLLASLSQPGPLYLTATNYVIGGSYGGNYGSTFNGVIDEVRYWNVARTPSQIAAFLHLSLPDNEPGMFGYWRLDEGTGLTTADSGGFGQNGLLQAPPPQWVESTAPIGYSPVAVVFTNPPDGMFVTGLDSAAGFVSDIFPGTAIATVTVSIQRAADGTYWTGAGWGAITALPTVVSGNAWSRVVGMPTGANLVDGSYRLSAYAENNVGQFGVATASVTVRKLGRPVSAARLPDGGVVLRFPGTYGITYRIQASPDLWQWTDVGNVTVDASGVLQYEDPKAATIPFRFFRTVTP